MYDGSILAAGATVAFGVGTSAVLAPVGLVAMLPNSASRKDVDAFEHQLNKPDVTRSFGQTLCHRLVTNVATIFPSQEAAAHPDTILELNVREFNVSALTRPHAPLLMTIRVQARLLRASDRTQLYLFPLEYRARCNSMNEWSKDDGAEFIRQVELARENISLKIIDQLFQSHTHHTDYLTWSNTRSATQSR
jgi:hypothetical protein